MSRKTLEEMLKKDMPVIEGKKMYIWGTGNTALLYGEGIKRLEKENFFHIEGYCDNNSEKWGSIFGGRPVITPKELGEMKEACVLICSTQLKVYKEISAQLQTGEVEHYLIDEVILKCHAKEILQVYDSLGDMKSKEVYEELIRCRMCNKLPDDEIYSGDAYFAVGAFKRESPGEIFVDCGGYVGDTIEEYLWMRKGAFSKIVAFEPDKSNYNAMLYRVERLKREWNIKDEDIKIYQLGVGRNDSESIIQSYGNNHGLGSKMIERKEEFHETDFCNIVTLDNFLEEPYDFLKADIESYEYGMLLGAQKGIKEYRPRLAICIYHNAVDFYSIPLLIQSFVPEYQLAVRHHSGTLAETVLYAWIPE